VWKVECITILLYRPAAQDYCSRFGEHHLVQLFHLFLRWHVGALAGSRSAVCGRASVFVAKAKHASSCVGGVCARRTNKRLTQNATPKKNKKHVLPHFSVLSSVLSPSPRTKVFDSSISKGRRFTFIIGIGAVIRGASFSRRGGKEAFISGTDLISLSDIICAVMEFRTRWLCNMQI